MKNLTIFLCFLFVFQFAYLQGERIGEYFILDSDTTYCVSLDIVVKDKVDCIECLDSSGNINTINDIIEKGIKSYCLNGRIFDLITVQKNNTRIRDYYWRKIDGKITLYTKGFYEDPGRINSMSEIASPIKYVRLDPGEYIWIKNNKVVKEKVKPFVMNCLKYRDKYKGAFNTYQLEYIIKLYNTICN
ncbi:hypothetical protein JYT51_00330 [Candidatus Amoebophilus asiaticus]|nr:hypothetical protein [Candidatus Amoebophilus asiaticus]